MEIHTQPFDICIVCALYEEAEAVLDEFSTRCSVSFTKEFSGMDRYAYQHTTIQNKLEEPLTVLVTWLSDIGPSQTGLDLKPFLHEFRPRFMAMTGICAGYRQKVKLGDLVVAQYAYHYEEGKIIRESERPSRHLPEMKTADPTSQVIQYARGFDGWKKPVREMKRNKLHRQLKANEEPRCVVEPMASGMAVRGDDPFPELREKYNRNTVALDMEAATFYRALRAVPHIHALVVKGVCDYADMRKNDAYHDYAARASAVYLLSFIQEYVTEQSMPRWNAPPSTSRVGPSGVWNISHTRNPHLVDLYLKNVVAITRQLPWGYLPGDFTSELEIDDVYVLPRLSSKEYRRVSVADEWLEREIIRQSGQSQKKEEKNRRPILRAEKPSYSSLYEIVQSGANATLLGYMGSGKSMAASYIALRLAKGEGQSIFGLSKPKIPILLRLGRMRETPASDLITFAIENAIANLDHATALKDILRQEWNTGNVLLILDALDEFRGEMQWISDEIVRLGNKDLNGSSVLLTSRPNAYRSVRLVGLKAFTLEELQREEMFEFIETWTKAFLKITGRTDLNARDHAKSLTNEIGRQSLVQEIASNQLLLTVLTILSLRPGGIRLDRVTEAGLLDGYVTDLIERERSKGAEAPNKYGTDLLRIVFSYTGFEVQRAQSGMSSGICTKSTLLKMLSGSKYLRSLDDPSAIADAVLKFWLDTGLIQQTDDAARSIRFRHQAFQYLGAALTMTYQSEKRLAEILDDVETNLEWADVRRLYFGLKAHTQSLLE
jgi:nucleoside phosphorylase